MTETYLSPIEVNAVRIIADAKHSQTPDFILFWQLILMAHDCKLKGHKDDYEAVLRIIEYVQSG